MAEIVKYNSGQLTNVERRMVKIRPSQAIGSSNDDNIKKAIYWAVTLLGISQTPDDGQKMIIIHSLRKTWPNITLNQFVQAFDMVSRGECDAKLQEHYNNFNPMYINKVLKMYTKKLSELTQRLIKEKPLCDEKAEQEKRINTETSPGNTKANEAFNKYYKK